MLPQYISVSCLVDLLDRLLFCIHVYLQVLLFHLLALLSSDFTALYSVVLTDFFIMQPSLILHWFNFLLMGCLVGLPSSVTFSFCFLLCVWSFACFMEPTRNGFLELSYIIQTIKLLPDLV